MNVHYVRIIAAFSFMDIRVLRCLPDRLKNSIQQVKK